MLKCVHIIEIFVSLSHTATTIFVLFVSVILKSVLLLQTLELMLALLNFF